MNFEWKICGDTCSNTLQIKTVSQFRKLYRQVLSQPFTDVLQKEATM